MLGSGMGWRYEWYSNGMLREVVRPDRKTVAFRYDALGRRTAKSFKGEVTHWVWDGNVPLHEWKYSIRNQEDSEEKVIKPVGDAINWVFEEGTFIPTAKIQGDKQYSIVSDYLGTPIQMYDEQGNKIWDCTLDIYGKVLTFEGSSLSDCPFRFQGQYEDEETGLYYNRFRYYNPTMGNYISQDPIRLNGGIRLYTYVMNSNRWLDLFGLETLAELLKDNPELLKEARQMYNETPEWWGIDPDNTDVFFRSQDEVKAIRAKPRESGGHHPHGLALGGPEKQKLTITGDRRVKGGVNPKHSKATSLQRRIIRKIKGKH